MPDPAIDALFAEIDTDETGSISYWQFLSWWKKQDQAAGIKVSDEQYNSSREIFLDYAADGGLSVRACHCDVLGSRAAVSLGATKSLLASSLPAPPLCSLPWAPS